jgi:protein ImuB
MFACLYSSSTSSGEDVENIEIERIARTFSPRIEKRGGSLVVLDLSGLDRLFGDPRAIGEELHRACPPSIAIAIASTCVAAELLSHTARHLTVVESGAEAAALAPLSIDVLNYVGAPPDLLATLARWGIATLGAFAALPTGSLASRIGQQGLVWQRVARGLDQRPFVPSPAEERFEETLDLEWPIEGIEPLAFVLGRLLEPLCARLERRDRAVAAIELRLRLAIARAWRLRRIELPAPMRDPRLLRTLLCLDLEGHPEDISESIDRLGLFIEPTAGRVVQFSLIAPPGITTLAPEVVATLMARLRALMGHDRCGSALLVDTHRPGAFAMADFPPAIRQQPASVRPDAARPLRALRRLRHPIPARVVVERGYPVRVATDRRGWSGGRVTWCAGPWRTSGDWWHTERPCLPPPYSWQEWDVSLSDRASYRIHEDRHQSRWFIDAILD